MLGVVLVVDRTGVQQRTAAGNYVGLVAGAIRAGGGSVELLPPLGAPPNGRRAHLGAIRRTVGADRPDVVLYYGQSVPTILWCWLVTRRTATRFVVHAVEWPPANRSPGVVTWLQAQAYAAVAFRFIDGAVVISAALEQKVRSSAARPAPAFRLPILVDAAVTPDPPDAAASGRPYVLYCGDLVGYRPDVEFLLRAFAGVQQDVALVLVGRAPAAVVASFGAEADRLGFGDRFEVQTEALPYDDLLAAYAGAEALVAPLPDDERSRARFPSKLADYLLSGRPVVASRVGEVATLLEDGRDAYLAPPGSEEAFSAALRRALEDPDRSAVGAAGRTTALQRLDHRQHGVRLVAFLRSLGGGDSGH